MIDIGIELSVFNNIKYYDEPHTYYIDGQEMLSATRLIGKFKQPFDGDYWANKKSKDRGITKEEILKEWKYKGDYACEKGNLLHDYAENYFNNKIFPYPKEKIINILGNNDVQIAFDKIKNLFDKFYEESYSKLIPIKSELIVGDEERGVCGMVDQIFWNNKVNELQVWDWKTNKEIKRNNKWQQFKEPISHLDVCEFNTYSLQLSLYKFLIEENTNLKLGDSYIVWFNENNEKYEPIKCRDYREEVVSLLEHYKDNK